jgi:alpha-glucoside transport system substrate-binding protein
MPIFDRQKRDSVDQLFEEFTQHRLGRRSFLERSIALGISASAASTLLAACGESNPTTPTTHGTVDLLTVWESAEPDSFSFRAVIYPFSTKTGITVNIEGNRDVNAVLTTRIQGGNPPDMAILPNPGKMLELARQNRLIKLDSFLDMTKIKADYAQSWIGLGSYNGGFYALFYKAANKGTVWYNPTQFKADNLQIPTTWDELIKLSDHLAGAGKYPWSMGVESGAATGWAATDWVAEIYLNESGPDMYDKWVTHKIPWTDPSIKSAFQKFGKIAGGNHYINGAPQSIVATNFQAATYPPFTSPPQAYMNYLGDFAAGFIEAQFPNAKPGTNFDFFPFPTINSQYQGAITGGADVVVALKDTPAVRQLVSYMATAEAQAIWVKRGGFTSPNKSITLSDYPDAVAQASAKMLTSASSFRFGAGDLMPSALQTAWWKAMITFIQDQTQLDSILSSLESTAQQAYTS